MLKEIPNPVNGNIKLITTPHSHSVLVVRLDGEETTNPTFVGIDINSIPDVIRFLFDVWDTDEG